VRFGDGAASGGTLLTAEIGTTEFAGNERGLPGYAERSMRNHHLGRWGIGQRSRRRNSRNFLTWNTPRRRVCSLALCETNRHDRAVRVGRGMWAAEPDPGAMRVTSRRAWGFVALCQRVRGQPIRESDDSDLGRGLTITSRALASAVC